MRRFAVLLALLCVSTAAAGSAAAAPSARAATTPLGWVEKIDRDGGTRITFRIVSLERAAGGWRLRVEIENRGTGPLAIAPMNWGIAEFASERSFDKPVRVFPARAITPRPPEMLAAGRTWKGVVSGRGAPDDEKWVRAVMGLFATRTTPTPFSWITDNALHGFTFAI